ncbi:MAG: AMP-binding protein [Alphaproteobacteria bacterium]|jgi:acyl-CoA synthetase (AMP-forming)/AMP-acid ligase II
MDGSTLDGAIAQADEAAERFRAEGYWTDRLLRDFFADAVARYPDKVAVKDDRFGELTYAELAATVSRLAAALKARGIGRGDRFVVALPNWQHVSAFALALNHLGAVSVHMPVTGGAHEYGDVLRITGAKGVVVPGEFRSNDFPSMIEGIPGGFAGLETRVTVGRDDAGPGWLTFDGLLSEVPADAAAPAEPVSASDLTCLLFTSGASGDPKGVMHSSNSIGAMNTTVAPIYGMGHEQVIFMGAPLGFSAGLVHGLRLAIYLGATLVLQESWNTERALETMARERATFTLATPTLLRDILDHERFPDFAERLPLQLIFCGGAPVPSGLLRAAREKLPRALTSVIWGMTEGIGTACRPGTSAERVTGTDGEPFLGTELKILREDGTEAPAGEEGDLVMRGPQRFVGYYKLPETNAEVFLPEGWFRTGDVGLIDADGHLKITGRRKDMIIRGGANIAPAEIEEQLHGDPRILDLVVVGMPDERLGERICACVVPSEGCGNLVLDDIVDVVRRKGLAKNKWPERLEIIDSVPMTSSGKIQRPVLQEYVRNKVEAEKAADPA